jgi:hypothetical protein
MTVDFRGLFRERPLHQSRVAIGAYRAFRQAAATVGVDVVLRTFYSPIPRLDQLAADAFDRESELPGVAWDIDAQLVFMRDRLSKHMREFCPGATAPEGLPVYVTENPSYPPLDAKVHYGMVRALRPRRVVELGSGYSTLVTAEAGRRNGAEGRPVELSVYDPFPGLVREDLAGLHALHRVPAQEIPLGVFQQLEGGDLLFVDTTHTVKLGSEVNYILLEVLPRLNAGVVVHIHDVFLPFEYPRQWMQDFGLYWNEQYLLQAFLAENDSWDVLAAVHALARLRRKALEGFLPADVVKRDGGGFWMRRVQQSYPPPA